MGISQKNVIDKTSKIVKRHGYCDFQNDGQFDSQTEEIVEKEFDFDEPTRETVWTWNSTTETFDKGSAVVSYRVWCDDCAKWFKVSAVSAPTTCPACSGGSVSDITSEQFAIRGKNISTGMPAGHHVFTLSGRRGMRRWRIHRDFVQFPAKQAVVPSSINFTNVIFDGTANLNCEEITGYGFLFSVTGTGKGDNWGLTSVEFDWEAAE
jgi:Zn finger protein HypA/HybF involved in hydrogenase expression